MVGVSENGAESSFIPMNFNTMLKHLYTRLQRTTIRDKIQIGGQKSREAVAGDISNFLEIFSMEDVSKFECADSANLFYSYLTNKELRD